MSIAAAVLRVVIVMGIFALCMMWLYQRGPSITSGPRNRRLSASEGLSLGKNARAVVLRVDGRELLVGVTPTAVALLAELDPTASASAELAAASESLPGQRPASGFSARFGTVVSSFTRDTPKEQS